MGEQVVPFIQDVEEAQIMTMREELEVNFGGDRHQKLFDLRRTVELGEAADYLLIGGSNGGNLCEVIGKKGGRKVVNMTQKGLRITVETVAKLEEKLSGDGKYHIDGQLKLATGRQATKVMEKFLPILRRLKKNRKLILVPSPRFVSGRPAAWTEEPTAPTGRRRGSSRACCPG
jgi:hypothetical protein